MINKYKHPKMFLEVSNQKRVDFKFYNKVTVKMCVEYFHECWKRRCIVLHEPEVQRKVLQDEVLAIAEESSKEEIVGLRRCVEVHSLSVNEVSAEEMVSWVRSARVFKKRASKNKNQDMRNMLMARVN